MQFRDLYGCLGDRNSTIRPHGSLSEYTAVQKACMLTRLIGVGLGDTMGRTRAWSLAAFGGHSTHHGRRHAIPFQQAEPSPIVTGGFSVQLCMVCSPKSGCAEGGQRKEAIFGRYLGTSKSSGPREKFSAHSLIGMVVSLCG